MYLHSPFRSDEVEKVSSFLKTQSFATLVSVDKMGVSIASHLPVNIIPDESSDYGKFITHLAKGNPHYPVLLEKEEILIIFLSNTNYISPSWFKKKESAPTQAFTAVHVYGRAKVIKDEKVLSNVMEEQVSSREKSMEDPWSMKELGTEGVKKRFKQIAGVEIIIDRVEANFHLLQDEEIENIEGVLNDGNLPDDMKTILINENKIL